MKRMTFLASLLLMVAAVVAEEAPTDSPAAKTNETGTVVFYRTRAAKGAAVRLNITGGDTGTVGILTNGSKLEKTYKPGQYTFVVTSPSIAGQDQLDIKVEAGKTYFVKGQTLWGWPAARCRLTLMDEKKGKAESDKIK